MPSDTQRGVLRGMAVAALVTVSVLYAAAQWAPAWLIPADDRGSRLAFVMTWDLALLLTLAACVARLARHRFFTPEDIGGGGLSPGTAKAQVLQSVLQNTLEQTVLGVGVHLAWAVIMPLGTLGAIPAAAMLFLAGRVLFAIGYSHGAPARAAGFGLTFYPTIAMLATVLVSLLAK